MSCGSQVVLTIIFDRDDMKLKATLKIQNDHIKKRREFLGMTQKEYADYIGISISRLQGFERLRYPPRTNKSIKHAQKIADDCMVNIQNIFPKHPKCACRAKLFQIVEGRPDSLSAPSLRIRITRFAELL